MFSPDPKSPLHRAVALLVGLSCVGLGLGPILYRHDLFYTNWFNQLMFAPLAVFFGVLIILFALFKPEWLGTGKR